MDCCVGQIKVLVLARMSGAVAEDEMVDSQGFKVEEEDRKLGLILSKVNAVEAKEGNLPAHFSRHRAALVCEIWLRKALKWSNHTDAALKQATDKLRWDDIKYL